MRFVAVLCLSVCFSCGPEPEEAQLGPKILPTEILGELAGRPVTLIREDFDATEIIAEDKGLERFFMARLIHQGAGLGGREFIAVRQCEGPALDYWTIDTYDASVPMSWDGEIVEFGYDASWAFIDTP